MLGTADGTDWAVIVSLLSKRSIIFVYSALDMQCPTALPCKQGGNMEELRW